MNITEFGEQYRVRVTNPNQKSWSLKDKIQLDDEPVVEGKCGMIQNLRPREQETDGNRLVMSLMAVPRNADMNKKLNGRAKDAEAAGMILKSRSGYETQWYFAPTVTQQADAAIKLVGARKRRTVVVTPEMLARLAQARSKPPLQCPLP